MAEAQPRRNLVGITAVVVMGTVLAYCFLPDSMLPIPPVFILIVWIGALASAVIAIVAGFISSRAWFLFVLFPVGFFLMTLNFEQSTEIKLRGDSKGAELVLSGSGKLVELVVFSPQYATGAQTINDPKFVLWSIHPSEPMSWGEPVWVLRSIRYGIVPKGYTQSIPENGHAAPLTDSEKPYFLSVTTANAPGTAGYFTVADGTPEWANNPPDGPCFTRQNNKDVRVPCLH